MRDRDGPRWRRGRVPRAGRGQTLNGLARRAGVRILGTSPDSIDLAEDRQRFSALLSRLEIPQPASGTATSREEARDAAASIGFPVVVRPSYVLGGRGMAIVYDVGTLDRYMTHAVDASPEHPVLIDRFLEDASSSTSMPRRRDRAVVIGGIMEHIEERESTRATAPASCRRSSARKSPRDHPRLHPARRTRAQVLGLITCSTRSRTTWVRAR